MDQIIEMALSGLKDCRNDIAPAPGTPGAASKAEGDD